MDSRELLEVNLNRSLTRLGELSPGSEEHSKLAKTIEGLYSQKTEETSKIYEAEAKKAESRNEVIKTVSEVGLSAFGTWSAFNALKAILQFEETGTITSKVYPLFQKMIKFK